MTAYIFRSSVSLLLMFGLYWFLLRKEKLFVFNRFFLIVSLAFSLVLPLITISVNFPTALQLNEIIPSYNYVAPEAIVADNIVPSDLNISQQYIEKETTSINIFTILLLLYISGVIMFLIRFSRNIYLILKRSKLSEKISSQGYRIVLTDDKTGPCCFFSNIFLNKDDYLNGKIDKELLNHELEHVRQAHTIDIILIEVVKIFYWFNPINLLYERAIRINHEYLADNGVINENSDVKSYTDKLLNFISCSSTMSLTSGSNNSFTKLRLMMMMKSRSGSFNYGARIAVTLCMGTVFFLLLSFKESKSAASLSKEGITTQQNVVKGIGLDAEKKPQNFQLENASEATIVNNIYNFSGNVIIRILKTNTNYTLIKSDSATYDKEKNIITVNIGTMEKYNSGDIDPFEKIYFVDLKYDAESGKVIAKKINSVVYLKDKK
jgi:beta-lactamase regulating signal transducer with metallopeptidase domain